VHRGPVAPEHMGDDALVGGISLVDGHPFAKGHRDVVDHGRKRTISGNKCSWRFCSSLMSKTLPPEALNHALRLSLEWGENFHKPVDERLRKKFPKVSAAQARETDTLCRSIQSFAFRGIEEVYFGKADEGKVRKEILEKWPWIDEENLTHLWSQGMYYAWHG